jgi:hypothetical protein
MIWDRQHRGPPTLAYASGVAQIRAQAWPAIAAPGNQRTLQTGTSVYHQENIQTGDAGRAAMRFHDNSNLQVGPKSSVKLDKFVYDPNKSAASVAVEAARGSFRFTTGQQVNGSYQVKTPYGTLGIRG